MHKVSYVNIKEGIKERSITMMMASQVVKVQREKLVPCITCCLCNKLFQDATTISECLHTFCRKCIYEKITQQELDHCPVCKISLGCAPLEKLRADHNLEDLIGKLFPLKSKVDKAPEVVPSVPFQAKRKERSLSSLVSTPKVSELSGVTRTRLKSAARKKFAVQEPSTRKPVVNIEDDNPECLSSPDTLIRKIAQKNKPNSSTIVESSKKKIFLKRMEKENAEQIESKADTWICSDHNVDVGWETRSDNRQYTIQDADDKSEPHNANEKHMCVPRTDIKENELPPDMSGSAKSRKLQVVRQKRRVAVAVQGMNIPEKAVLDANIKTNARFKPIWFSIVASNDQEGGEPLPQISSCYLRVRDGNLPVSFIKKYLVKKMNLSTEAEVEIFFRGQPLIGTLQLHNLSGLWRQTSLGSKRVKTFVGSSAKEFVMVLSYGRKAQPP